MTPRLQIRSLSKTFGMARVLSDVELSIEPGEIHALVGQNGSGKSTLIKIVAGYHAPDRNAQIFVDGRELRIPVQPEDLRAAGIAIVHQDLGLIDHLSVADNIGIGQYTRGRWSRRIDTVRERESAAAALSRLRIGVDPRLPVRALPTADRVTVAIARALRSMHDGSGLVILDEATRTLSRDALGIFYEMLRHAVGRGSSVLVVAHSLPEVMAMTDRVTVLRDGKIVGAGLPTAELSEQEIARLMLGRGVEAIGRPAVSAGTDQVVVRGLRSPQITGMDLALERGEIVGLTGTPGSGFEDIPYFLAGARRAQMGTIEVGGHHLNLARADVPALLRAGVVLVPERRDMQGLAFGLRVSENITLPRLRERGGRFFSGLRWQREEAEQVVETLDVRPKDPMMAVGKLSGGNQQKVLLGKWLVGGPSFIVLHEPTQGVDVAARQDILAALVRAAHKGCSVLLTSGDPADLSAICHRVIVVANGGVARELHEPEADEIVDAVYAGNQEMTMSGGA